MGTREKMKMIPDHCMKCTMEQIRIKHAIYGPWFHKGEHEGEPPPGLLHGDSWGDTIQRANHGAIVGIVDFVGKTRYGYSSRGVPQYLFHPADTRYPPMIVGSKAAPVANQWGIVSTKDMVWDTKKARWPSVSLTRLLGNVGDPVVEQEALLARYLRPIPKSKPEFFSESALNPETDWTVFNIDPEGCRDVDDVFAWRSINGITEFAICIADVAALVPEGSPLDERARLLGQTLYREGTVVEPMLPTSISESAGSLIAGQPRRVVAAVWTGAVGPEWRCMSLVNQRTYTYESILEDTETSNTLLDFLKTVGLDAGTDPHRWVEVAMVAYNCAVAQKLRACGAGILRRHQGIRAVEFSDLAEKTGCPELRFLGYAAGEYVSAAEEDVEHVGLGAPVYCHATSPLRRYADLVNQRILKGLLKGSDCLDFNHAVWLNERAKEARAYERDSWCLAHLSATELRSATGWIVKITGRCSVYVPAWRRVVKVRESPGNVGDAVEITAFWDTRGTPEHRFVFRLKLL